MFNKKEKYLQLLPRLRSLTEGETDIVANMANMAAAIKETFGFFWVGFYIVKENRLVLGRQCCYAGVRRTLQYVLQGRCL